MPKKPAARSKKSHVIGIDLGGTKVAAAVVDATGKVLHEKRIPTELAHGWPGLKKQLVQLCRDLQKEYGKAKGVGIGSAGPLHAPSGKLLDPTNFGWPSAVVSIAKQMQAALKIPVILENDAAAAALAEMWKGGAGKDCVILTLGTGLGAGIIIDGKVLRGCRGLHPEAGHILLRPGDRTALCGCGNYGCSEALLSGMNFGKRAAEKLQMPGITAKQVAELAKNGNLKALALFAEYSELLAAYIFDMVTLFYPEKVILTGSFAEAHGLFLPEAENRLRALLERRLKTMPIYPQIRLSRLGNRAGVLGGAYIALHPDYAG